MNSHYPLIIIGSGPAGFTAAIYAARANLSPLILEGAQPGGQLTITTEIENFPGFPNGIMGPELMENMKKQAERFGTRIISEQVEKVELSQRPFTLTVSNIFKVIPSKITCDALIIATGASAKLLGIESELKYMGHGVSACATCDGFFFKKKEIAVLGGGDSAMEEACFLTKFASKVTIIHRRDEFRASKIMIDRAKSNPKVEFLLNAKVEEFLGDGSKLTGILLTDKSGKKAVFNCSGAFIAIGHQPNSSLFKEQLEMDGNGYLITKGKTSKTSMPGVFACGDIQDYEYRQAISAAGSGCMAAIDAERYLESLHELLVISLGTYYDLLNSISMSEKNQITALHEYEFRGFDRAGFPNKKETPIKMNYLYYETQNYKNYKYKMLNIDLDLLQKKIENKRKIDLSDFNYPSGFLQEFEKKKLRKPLFIKEQSSLSKICQKDHNSSRKLDISENDDNRFDGLTIKNSTNSTNSVRLPYISLNKKLTKQKKEKEAKKVENENKSDLFNMRILTFLEKNEKSMIQEKKRNNFDNKMIEKKFGGGFKILEKKRIKPEKAKADKDEVTETSEKVDLNNKRIRDILKNKKIQKENKLKGNNMTEFFKFNQNNPKNKNDLTVEKFKTNFEIFSINDPLVSDRIMLALEVDPFDDEYVISWEKFAFFKKVVITYDASLHEFINFICKFINPYPKQNFILTSEFFPILNALTDKLGSYSKTVLDLYIDNFTKLDLIHDLKLNTDDLRQAFLNRDIWVIDILDLMVFKFKN